jgi:hypothetical protein
MSHIQTRWGVQLTPHKGPTDEAAVAELEVMIGTRLPDDYRELLVTTNGGEPNPSGFAQSRVHWFFAVIEVQRRRSIMGARIPGDLLAIATDPFGNLICLGLDGSRHGQVYFWDHEREGEGAEEDRRDLELTAESFDAFMRSLAPVQSGG